MKCKNCGDIIVVRKGGDIRVFHAFSGNDRKCKLPQLRDEDKNDYM